MMTYELDACGNTVFLIAEDVLLGKARRVGFHSRGIVTSFLMGVGKKERKLIFKKMGGKNLTFGPWVAVN